MPLVQLTDDEAREIEAKRKANRPEFLLKPVDDYSLQEKAKHFDRLHKMALDHWDERMASRCDDDDFGQYAKEALMLLLGSDRPDAFWAAYNALIP